MSLDFNDDEWCQYLINAFRKIFPTLIIQGGAEEPFYEAPKGNLNAVLYFRDNYPRSLLHEISHYCLAGDRRRSLDDFGYWYSPCGRTEDEQLRFEAVEARPQGLEKAICEVVGLKFSPSLDDFSGRPPSEQFLVNLEKAYQEMSSRPPLTAQKLLSGLRSHCCGQLISDCGRVT
ncbi:elongation factor P hydroxylase [Pseudoalteromonas prydzensis]|uniref:elongation factor P hydroxylase n=1 Tax=Pseudoalteromonas prydzensis TaxID=182141 RepID=UPI0024BC0492|nr:elongation factor P hydroxylase [Pseudoalteromonas prydzensis]